MLPTKQRRTSAGFTLVEMLVVLVIVGLSSAVVIPRLTTMSERVDFALKREAFEQMLNGLAYQAFRQNQDIVLSGAYTAAGRDARDPAKPQSSDAIRADMRTLPVTATEREHQLPMNAIFAKLEVPDGWQAIIPKPIYFRGSGYCGGGDVELLIGRASYRYALTAPLCHAVLVE
jgi:prepilin-type N-terminal cleavage/methylation domain-containing protein